MSKEAKDNVNKTLIEEVARKAGLDAGQLRQAVNQGDMQGVLSQLNPNVAGQINQIMSDPETLQKMLSSKQIQQMMKKFGDR